MAQAWSRALSLLAKSVQAVRLYDAGHASAVAAIGEFEEALREIRFADEPRVFVGVNQQGFWLGDECVTADEGVRLLGVAISRRDVAGLEWSEPAGALNAAGLVSLFVRLAASNGEDVVREWPEGLGVRLVPLGAHGLEFVRGAISKRTNDGGEGGGAEAWRGVWKSILEGCPGGDEAGVVALASGRVRECLNAAGEDERAAAMSLLSQFVQSTPASVANGAAMDSEGQEVDRGRLEAAMVEAAMGKMNAELRASILSLGAVSGAGWMATLAGSNGSAEFGGGSGGGSGRVSVQAEIAAALVGVDRSGGKPPSATMQLLSKMMGLSELSSDVRRECEGLASKWGMSGIGGVTGVVQSLMGGGGVQDYCPEDYRASLDAAAKGAGAAVMSPLSMADFDEKALFARMADIAEYLCEHPSVGAGEPGEGGVVNFVAEHAQGLAGAGRTAVVWKAWGVSEDVKGGRVDAAARERLLGAMGQQGVLEELMRGESGELERAAKAMPRRVLKEVAGRVHSGRISPGHGMVGVAVKSSAVEDVVAVAREEVGENLGGAVALLEHVESGALFEAAWSVAEGQSRQVRGAVMGVCDRRLSVWTGEMIERAVQDASPEVMELGVRRLMAFPKGASAKVLMRVLMGETSGEGELPGARATGAIVHAMAMQGEKGVCALSELLTAWSGVVKRDRVRVCRRIAEELEGKKEIVEAARALKVWRRSVGHALSLFVGEASERAAA